jgi:hypothetical protein
MFFVKPVKAKRAYYRIFSVYARFMEVKRLKVGAHRCPDDTGSCLDRPNWQVRYP